MECNDVVIAAYGRSAIAKAHKGALHGTHPVEFAGQVVQRVLEKLPALDTAALDDVIIGCARPEKSQCSNPARLIALRAGIPATVPAQTITRFCSSGLQAIVSGAQAIRCGEAEAILCAGVESMSTITMGTPKMERCAWLSEHLPDAYISMGLTAENVAIRCGVTRSEMEAFAVESHHRAARAQETGLFAQQIVPVSITDESGKAQMFQTDEGIRATATLETLSKLKPAFCENGLVTAATASQISDGAAALVLMSAAKAKELELRPLGRFIAHAVIGIDPAYMGLGPIEAVRRLLKRTGMSAGDFDAIELNEAFAAQAIPCIRELGFDPLKVNPQGGAIALGHPLGATGAILTCKLLSQLERVGGRFGLTTMCIGGGMGAAAVFERL